MNGMLSRRGFLRQSFAFSALASLGSLPVAAESGNEPNFAAKQLLILGDWGYEDFTAQSRVAGAMQRYVRGHGIKTDALLMLGDNWYGPLPGGAESERWKTQFEEMYPANVFACPALAIPGNHDYQRAPDSKYVAELNYALRAGTRWYILTLMTRRLLRDLIHPSHWVRVSLMRHCR